MASTNHKTLPTHSGNRYQQSIFTLNTWYYTQQKTKNSQLTIKQTSFTKDSPKKNPSLKMEFARSRSFVKHSLIFSQWLTLPPTDHRMKVIIYAQDHTITSQHPTPLSKNKHVTQHKGSVKTEWCLHSQRKKSSPSFLSCDRYKNKMQPYNPQ